MFRVSRNEAEIFVTAILFGLVVLELWQARSVLFDFSVTSSMGTVKSNNFSFSFNFAFIGTFAVLAMGLGLLAKSSGVPRAVAAPFIGLVSGVFWPIINALMAREVEESTLVFGVCGLLAGAVFHWHLCVHEASAEGVNGGAKAGDGSTADSTPPAWVEKAVARGAQNSGAARGADRATRYASVAAQSGARSTSTGRYRSAGPVRGGGFGTRGRH